MALADSQISRGIMHESTTQRINSWLPSCSASARACMGSVTVLENAPLRLPLIGDGSFFGVISSANAPALKTGLAANSEEARQASGTRRRSRFIGACAQMWQGLRQAQEAPSTNLQAPEKHQARLELGVWILELPPSATPGGWSSAGSVRPNFPCSS